MPLPISNPVSDAALTDTVRLPIDVLVALFDSMPETAFFMKDTAGRYTSVNLTLVRRTGHETRTEVLGRRAVDVFPDPLMGSSYTRQDDYVLHGNNLENQLEVHPFNRFDTGWCVTSKYYLKERDQICGLIGASRDLGLQAGSESVYQDVGKVMEYIQRHYNQKVSIAAMAEVAGLSTARLGRLFRHAFHITPQQMITKLRIESAMEMLRGAQTIAEIAAESGFVDQSAFSRQFRTTVGMTPSAYRRTAMAMDEQVSGGEARHSRAQDHASVASQKRFRHSGQ